MRRCCFRLGLVVLRLARKRLQPRLRGGRASPAKRLQRVRAWFRTEPFAVCRPFRSLLQSFDFARRVCDRA